MPGKGLIIAVAVLVLLGAGVYWSNSHPKEAAPEGGAAPTKLLSLAATEVERVTLERREAEKTVLENKGANTWRLTAPLALATEQEAVQSFLSAVCGLTAEKIADEKPTELASFGLQAPFLKITVALKGNKQRTILIGDDAPVGGGVFAQVDGDAKVYTLSGMTRSNLDKHGADLRDRRLLTFDAAKLARVEVAGKGGALEFSKSGANEWTMLKPKAARADSWAVDELVRQLKEAKLDATLTSDQESDLVKQFAGAAPLATITVTDASGSQKLELRKNKDNRVYAKSSQLEGAHLLGEEAAKAFEKGAEEYRNKKVFDFGFDDPVKVDYKDGTRTLALAKVKEGWTAGGKPVDSVGVQNLIDRLRDLSASKFVDAGFANPSIEITVTAKKGEKVALAKAGASWIAKREGDPALYELDAKAVADLQAATDIKARPAK